MEIKPEKTEINAHREKIKSRDNIKTAINLVWLSIGLSAFSQLLNIWANLISPGDFMGSILVMGLCCIIPYKLSQRSNAARYVYAVLVGIGILFILSGIDNSHTKIDIAFYIITFPLDIYALIKLFSDDASEWFNGNN
jgi:hypothetical protein